MNLRDYRGALPHRRCDAFGRVAADIADCENPRDAGLQSVTLCAGQVPLTRRARHYVPLLIQLDTSVEPRGIRFGADEREQLPGRYLARSAGYPVANRHRGEAPGV